VDDDRWQRNCGARLRSEGLTFQAIGSARSSRGGYAHCCYRQRKQYRREWEKQGGKPKWPSKRETGPHREAAAQAPVSQDRRLDGWPAVLFVPTKI
jgi:hypothetical protein